MKYCDSKTKFRFGDGDNHISNRGVCIHAEIGGVNVKIEAKVISNDLPLALSKSPIQKANTKLNFTNDTVTMFDKTFHKQWPFLYPIKW